MDYKSSGVDIKKGDQASHTAYQHAKTTFPSRKGLIGQAVTDDGGFSGMIDIGNFYMSQCCDTVGTKITIAEKTQNFAGLGYDLLAMVADDAICNGSEVTSLTNTFETNKIKPKEIDAMMASLAKACQEQKIIITGGEIAEVGEMTNGTGWGASAVGIIKKEKIITNKTVAKGQAIIGLKGRVLRSNGISLARKICEKNFGKDWHKKEWQKGTTWGEILLTPSKIFHRLLLDNLLGNFDKPQKFKIHGIVHITGGGIPGNLPRIFQKQKNLGATLPDLHTPHQAIKDLAQLGKIKEAECYRTWHSGTAMMIIANQEDADKITKTLNQAAPETEAKIVGEITDTNKIQITSKFSGQNLEFKYN